MPTRTLPQIDAQHGETVGEIDVQSLADKLRSLHDTEYGTKSPPVKVARTGRKAGALLGRYQMKTRCIHINDGDLGAYGVASTVVHELAHHYQHTCPCQEGNREVAGPRPSHGTNFQVHHWRLRQLAHRAGLLPRLEDVDNDLAEAARKLISLRRRGGHCVIEAGKELAAARKRCWAVDESFEVFLLDCVLFDRTTAYDYIRAFEMGMPPDLNFTTMRFLMRIKDEALRKTATKDAVDGTPLRILKVRYGQLPAPSLGTGGAPSPEEEIAALLHERVQLVRRLDAIDSRLKALDYRERQMAARTVTGHGSLGACQG